MAVLHCMHAAPNAAASGSMADLVISTAEHIFSPRVTDGSPVKERLPFGHVVVIQGGVPWPPLELNITSCPLH